MDVILQEDLPELGKAGDVVRVKDGYARNYLVPRGKAVAAAAGNLRQVAHQRQQAAVRQARLQAGAEALAQRLAGFRLLFRREAGPEGKLFGSVTAADIATALREKDVTVDRRQLRLPEPIKQCGEHSVEVHVMEGVNATMTIVVEPA